MAIRQKNDKKRTALLEATLSLIINNGFHDAPMSKIAKMAEVSPATIYIYFKNKQDLINQLYLETKASFCTHAFKNYDENKSIKESFELIWFNIAHYKLQEVEAATFLSQCDNATIVDDESRQNGLMHLQPLLDLWERGQQKGIVKQISPYLLYAYTIYPLAFLTSIQQKDSFHLTENNLNEAFQSAWDSIKI